MAPLLIIGGLLAIAIGLIVGYLAGRFLVRAWRARHYRRLCWHCEARKCLTRKGADGRCRRCWKRWRDRCAEAAHHIENTIPEGT